jgi:hypothetical protein
MAAGICQRRSHPMRCCGLVDAQTGQSDAIDAVADRRLGVFRVIKRQSLTASIGD